MWLIDRIVICVWSLGIRETCGIWFMLFLCNCVNESHSYEFVDTSTVRGTVQILIQVGNWIPGWIIDSELKVWRWFHTFTEVFFLFRRNMFKELLVCSIEWHLKMAAVDESERSAAFVLQSVRLPKNVTLFACSVISCLIWRVPRGL